MAKKPDPTSILAHDRRFALALATKVGPARARRLLQMAAKELERRLRKIKPSAAGTWTAVHTKLVLRQVRDILGPLQVSLGTEIAALGKEAATGASKSLVRYAKAAEQAYAGITVPLAIDEAAVLDVAVSGSNASVLRRIASDPSRSTRARKGVLARYGEATIGAFEQVLQTRFLARVPWEEARQQLIDQSPFLQGQPAHWAERILRTEVMGAHNAASHAAIAALGEQLGDACKILSCTFDIRTGSDSIAVHGQIRRTKEPFDTWYGPVMHPPDRPNDRAIVVMHRASWPIPAGLEPRSRSDVVSRWRAEGRKGSPPPTPKRSTIPVAEFGKRPPPRLPGHASDTSSSRTRNV